VCRTVDLTKLSSEDPSTTRRCVVGNIIGFPNPVNETSARVVAGGVVAMAGATVALDQPWLLLPLTYGFAARVLTGPKLSPLGQFATRVVTPRLNIEHRFVPGPPKRLAQGVGLAMAGTALVLTAAGHKRTAYRVLGGLVVAAGLEAFFGICLACRMFPVLMRLGLIPEDVCRECSDIWSRDRRERGGAAVETDVA
jgi:uncharacterized protein DUF4395